MPTGWSSHGPPATLLAPHAAVVGHPRRRCTNKAPLQALPVHAVGEPAGSACAKSSDRPVHNATAQKRATSAPRADAGRLLSMSACDAPAGSDDGQNATASGAGARSVQLRPLAAAIAADEKKVAESDENCGDGDAGGAGGGAAGDTDGAGGGAADDADGAGGGAAGEIDEDAGAYGGGGSSAGGAVELVSKCAAAVATTSEGGTMALTTAPTAPLCCLL